MSRGSATEDTCGLVNASDLLFYIALALLPVDGTTLGIPLPYWTPLSPWVLIAYVLVNWRLMAGVVRTFLPFFIFPVVLAALSSFGWLTIGVHTSAAIKSFVGIGMFVACIAALEIARIKRLPARAVITVLVATYSFAFLVGVVQFVAVQVHFESVTVFFQRMMYRSYVAVRPQFLFAEPSYIGMHLFGVLLPAYWMTRDRRLPVVIGVFAVGSIVMGAGVRIILDCFVAVILWCIAEANFRKRAVRWGTGAGVVAVAGVLGETVALNPRLGSIASKGLIAGDASMTSRIFHMFAPAQAWWDDSWHFVLGFGAGNISDAVREGYSKVYRTFLGLGGKTNPEIEEMANPPAQTFTMSAYTSFITEFGVIAFVALVVLVMVWVTRNHAWNRKMVCWLLLVAYLYVQFEAYGFYALALVVWGAQSLTVVHSQRATELVISEDEAFLPPTRATY
jgi:hypothetical protein